MYRKENEDCAHCRWYHDGNPNADGIAFYPTCRRHAPLVTGGLHTAIETVWPRTLPSDVCGDFNEEPIAF